MSHPWEYEWLMTGKNELMVDQDIKQSIYEMKYINLLRNLMIVNI